MDNNVYVRSNRSIFSISITRLISILPLMLYGIYKNGIFLYRNKLISAIAMFKPIILIFGSALIGALVNIIYEYLIKKNRDEDLLNIIFSSFHIEYAILLACIMSINVNLLIYFIVLLVFLLMSKFIDNRINIVCLTFLAIYTISFFISGFAFPNIYEASNSFSLNFIDYLMGRASGGLASTHIILLILAVIGLSITNNNKTSITISAIVVYLILALAYSLFSSSDFANIIFSNNYFFIVSLIATDSVTSCYTNRGMYIFGFSIGLLSFAFYFINPIIAPVLAVAIVSIFNSLIDHKIKIKKIERR